MSGVQEQARLAHQAFREFLQTGTTRLKNDVLDTIAVEIGKKKTLLIQENKKDLAAGEKTNLSKALLDRLALNEKRIQGMVTSCKEVAALNDPVGRITDMTMRPQGFKVGRMRVPIGVIGIIYEARPNVTVEAAILCLKAGNSVILRGGSSAFHTNIALVKILKDALQTHRVNPNLISYIESTDRKAVDELLIQDAFVHMIIPRGGENLIRNVVEKSRIPVLKHYKGVCHVYIHEQADLNMAIEIAVNAKVQRPAVCNAAETLLVDEKIADEFLPKVLSQLIAKGVEIRGCDKTRSFDPEHVKPVTNEDYFTEFLDLILAVKVVSNLDEAVNHINTYGSAHTDAIVTKDIQTSNAFVNRVDSASVMVNASTRLSDGGVYGLGAEIGISTDKLHARGPMGLEELTTYKWIVQGNGHIRE